MLWFWAGVLILIIIISIFYFFLFYSGIQVKNILISGNQKVSSKDIENLVSENINVKFFSVGKFSVASGSIFLINSNKLTKEIINKFPTIGSLEINKKYNQTLLIHVKERISAAIFCSTNCYLIDNSGTIFEPLNGSEQNMIIVRQNINPGQISIGEKAVQQDMMDLIFKAENDLKDKFKISVTAAQIVNSERLNVITSENWQIYFDLSPDVNADSQITKLNLLLSGGISADSRKKLRYIDLRPKDRAIVCDNQICGG